jgi:hypothetical protein
MKSRTISFIISSRLIFRCVGFRSLVKQQVEIFSSLGLMAASWKIKNRFPAKAENHLSAIMPKGLRIYLISCSKGTLRRIGWGTALQDGNLMVRSPIVSLGYLLGFGSSLDLDWTYPITEMSIRIISWEIKAAGATHICLLCRNSESLILLEPSGPVQTCKRFCLTIMR